MADKSLIKEKHDIIRLLDSETDDKKRMQHLKRLGDVEKEILNSVKQEIAQGLKKNHKPSTKTTTHDERSLRRIMRKKYEYYKDLGLEARKLYGAAVDKKKHSKKIDELIRNPKKRKEAIEEVLKF